MSPLEQTLGFKTLGNGPETVFIIHDWFSDLTGFDGLQPYLNTGFYKYLFIDLRGYGLSKTIYGSCTIEEVSQDILAIANKLKIDRFHLVGHAMGGQIAQYLPVTAPNRVKSIVAICPVPACGNPVPDDVMQHLEAITKGDIINAKLLIQYMTQNRYHDWFYERKALNWFSCSIPQARVAYLKTFCETDVSNLVSGLEIPILLICGDFDAAAHSSQRMQQTVMHYFKNAQLVSLPSGHYPMEEIPILLASTMEKFWNKLQSF